MTPERLLILDQLERDLLAEQDETDCPEHVAQVAIRLIDVWREQTMLRNAMSVAAEATD